MPGGRFINDRIASFTTLKSLIAWVAANAVSSNCDRYFRFAKIANRYSEAVLAFNQKSQITKAPAIIAINRKNLRPQLRSRNFFVYYFLYLDININCKWAHSQTKNIFNHIMLFDNIM